MRIRCTAICSGSSGETSGWFGSRCRSVLYSFIYTFLFLLLSCKITHLKPSVDQYILYQELGHHCRVCRHLYNRSVSDFFLDPLPLSIRPVMTEEGGIIWGLGNTREFGDGIGKDWPVYATIDWNYFKWVHAPWYNIIHISEMFFY